MRNWFGGVMIAAVSAAATAAVLLSGIGSTAAQTEGAAWQAPRLAGTDHPDLNGIWQNLTTANWDIEDHSAAPGPLPALLGAWGAQPAGQSIVEGGELPYRPEALERRNANYAQRLAVDPFNLHTVGDPEAKCYAPGVPRAMYMPYPFQIVQMPEKILIVFGYSNISRYIQLENHEEAPIDFWMGWSNGHWEGDTLVVDVTGFNGLTWLDRAGNFTSSALHVVERYTPAGPNTIMYEATVDDPEVFTRPWTLSFPLYRRLEANVQLLDFRCVPFTEEYIYGSLAKEGSFVKKGS
ncbi:MAG: hypothetical protein OXF27_17565 [Acidobacteria bacterium]|nr:hypothetical protein [Acidobacteriota bacterium]